MPLDGIQRDPSFELRTVPFPLCRHLLAPPLLTLLLTQHSILITCPVFGVHYRISSPAADCMMVSDTPTNACRSRSTVGVSVILRLFSGCKPGRVACACSRDRRRTNSVTVKTRTPSVSRYVRPSIWSLSLTNNGAIWRQLLRRLKTR